MILVTSEWYLLADFLDICNLENDSIKVNFLKITLISNSAILTDLSKVFDCIPYDLLIP